MTTAQGITSDLCAFGVTTFLLIGNGWDALTVFVVWVIAIAILPEGK